MLWSSIGIDEVLMKWNIVQWEKLAASLLFFQNPPLQFMKGIE